MLRRKQASADRILAHAQASRSRLMYALIQNGTITMNSAMRRRCGGKAQEAWYVASWLGALAASWVLLRVLGPKWSR